MAGELKPNIAGLGREGVFVLNESYVRVHLGVIDVPNDISGLFNGKIQTFVYPTVVLTQVFSDYIDFTIGQRSTIWAFANQGYSDGGGVSGKAAIIEKWNGSTFIPFATTLVTPTNSTWYKLLDNAYEGRYRIKAQQNYISFGEWYVENLDKSKCFIESNNSIKTIEGESIKDTLLTKPLSKSDFISQGFDDLSKLTQSQNTKIKPMSYQADLGDMKLYETTITSEEYPTIEKIATTQM